MLTDGDDLRKSGTGEDMNDDYRHLGLHHIDEASALHVAQQLRGITEATVRFVGHHPEFEDEFIHLLFALNVSVRNERIEKMVPEPHHQFSFRFSGSTAVITVAPDVDPGNY